MHIPRQSGPGAARADGQDGAEELRARRRHLVDQLRALRYWQRLVQARTDLSVAGLLYPAPVTTAAPSVWTLHGVGEDPGAPVGLLGPPPEGLDVQRLLDGPSVDGPGAHLDRLRGVSAQLLRHSRALREELDLVTSALHDSITDIGPDDGGQHPGVGEHPVMV